MLVESLKKQVVTMDSMISRSASSHRLEGRALKKWWQIDDMFAIKPAWKTEPDKFSNAAIRQQLMFFLMLPFALGLYTYIGMTSETKMDFALLVPVLVVNGCLISVLFAYFLHTMRRHLYRVLDVHVTDNGLVFQAPFLKRSVRWDQISDAYLNQDHDYILETTQEEEFVLSNELTDSERLFEVIGKRARRTQDKFSYCYRLQNESVDAPAIACLAIVVAVVSSMSRVRPEEWVGAVAISSVCIMAAVLWWRFHLLNMARVVRIGDSSILLQSCKNRKEIMWDQITDVKQLGALFLIRSRSDWFVVHSGKKEPVAQKLIECKQTRNLITG